MRKPSKATTKPPQQRPSEGGSYLRRPDGGIERQAVAEAAIEQPAPAGVPETGDDEQ